MSTASVSFLDGHARGRLSVSAHRSCDDFLASYSGALSLDKG